VGSPRSVLVVGPPGSGRRTLLRRLGEPALEVTSAPPAGAGRVLATSSVVLDGFDVVVQVPPLRARPTEIPVMAEAFLATARTLLGRPRLHLAPEALALLEQWSWPGNVRELKNVMLRAARASVRDEVSRDSLPAALAQVGPSGDLRDAMRLAERELLLEALGRTRWNVTATAQRLGMPRRTVVYRMAKLGLKRPAR
jgi:DNA-binding NtrC family response regulator